MKTPKHKHRTPLAEFVEGQVWRMENSNLHIGMIGKTLVHYKHFKLAAKRAPISLTNKASLAEYLLVNNAVLVAV